MTAHNTTISEILLTLIKTTEITEAHLAKIIGMPRATINKIATGKIVNPRSSTLNLIAKYFNITIDQLVGNEPLFDSRLKCFL